MSAAVLEIRQPLKAVRVGVALLIGAELMFFAGLISAFLVFRGSAVAWPPLGQPRLPVVETFFNTLCLLASGVLVWRAVKGKPGLTLGLGLGALFVLLQGREWTALLAQGLTLRSSQYGSFFYLLIGMHALHCLAGLAYLVFASMPKVRAAGALEGAAMYWTFVVALWPLLYALVYLW